MATIQAKTTKSTAEKIAALSESAGTPFNAAEYLKSLADSAEEISEEQLHTVAGETFGIPTSKTLAYQLSLF